jgi:hypothetical protein
MSSILAVAHVAVQDPGAMHVLEGAQELARDLERVLHGERLDLQNLVERRRFVELHRVVRAPIGHAADLVDRRNTRAVHETAELCLERKERTEPERCLAARDLRGDDLPPVAVRDGVDDGEGPLTDHALDGEVRRDPRSPRFVFSEVGVGRIPLPLDAVHLHRKLVGETSARLRPRKTPLLDLCTLPAKREP